MDRHQQEKKRASAYNAMDEYQQEKKRSSAFAAMDGYQHEKDPGLSDNIFNPIFSSLHNVSEDSGHRKYLDAPMEPPSPYRPKAADTESTSDEALKHLRTANSITISPGMLMPSAHMIEYWRIANHDTRIIREAVSQPTDTR